MLSGNTIKGAPQLEQITWDDLDKRKYYIWGPTTFLFVRAIVYPSNLVKTRLQVQSSAHPLYKGTFDAFGKIFRQEGVAGLYKGFGASTVNVAVGNIYITVYELTRKFFLQNSSFSDKAANFVGGACASLVSQTVVVPLDIVSQRMMISGQGMSRNQSRQHDRGFFSVIKHIYQRKGLRGFYKGYLPSVATYAPSSSIWWGSYGLLLPIYYNLLDSWNLEPFVQQSKDLNSW
jgi:solute carrier family 25 protein 44